MAQDGSGQFKTIQAALSAFKPGQVVRVLDRGPYRESLQMDSMPDDTGLISDQNAVLELPRWDGTFGHSFGRINGFRLSGFELVAPDRDTFGSLTHWRDNPSGLVIEDCRFRPTVVDDPWPTIAGMELGFEMPVVQAAPVWVRHCALNCSIGIYGTTGQNATVVIEENLFHLTKGTTYLHSKTLKRLLIRRNVFATHGPQFEGLEDQATLIEISNNTIIGGGTQFKQSAPKAGVTICNNIIRWGVYFIVGAEENKSEAIRGWQVGHNSYLTYGAHPDSVFPRTATDIDDPKFLSFDPAHPDYLRIPADSPLATAGAGGAWPPFIGALRPGPAPEESDWFARLRKTWTADSRLQGSKK